MTQLFQIDPIWKGKTVVILAGGPSLSLKQVRHVVMARLEDRCRIIAVNDAVYLAWLSDWLNVYDQKWLAWHIDRIQHFRGVKTTVDSSVPHQWVTGYLNRTAKRGFDPDPHCVRGGTSGYQALHIAIHVGAAKIVLLGMDMSAGHWFGNHPDGRDTDLSDCAEHFDDLLPVLKERGISIFNCSPDSNINSFQKAQLEEVI